MKKPSFNGSCIGVSSSAVIHRTGAPKRQTPTGSADGGFEYNFAVANLERIRRVLPEPLRTRTKRLVAENMRQNHFESGWVHGDPRFRFVPILRMGHYRVDEVLPTPSPSPGRPAGGPAPRAPRAQAE